MRFGPVDRNCFALPWYVSQFYCKNELEELDSSQRHDTDDEVTTDSPMGIFLNENLLRGFL